MTIEQALTIVAILTGPIAALWIQRWLDKKREIRKRRSELFRTIWATRTYPQRLQYRHVEALNMVGIDFAGDSSVIEAWEEYLDRLNSPVPDDEIQKTQFFSERDVKFHNLIFAISQSVGYKFTRLEVEKQHYAPIAHGNWAEQETVLRNGLTGLFKNETALPIRVVDESPAKR